MTRSGRPRITTQAYLDSLIAAYKTKFGVECDGFPPWHRAVGTHQAQVYGRLYRVRDRLRRYARNQCTQCSNALESITSVLCNSCRATTAARSGQHKLSLEGRQFLRKRQEGICPICYAPVDIWDDVDHDHRSGRVRGLVHNRCNRIYIKQAEDYAINPTLFLAARRYLEQEHQSLDPRLLLRLKKRKQTDSTDQELPLVQTQVSSCQQLDQSYQSEDHES